jgi:hypothetical protein
MYFVFIHIMERPVSDIFPTCVFNNIVELIFIFSPRVFKARPRHDSINLFNFNGLNLLMNHQQFL